MVLVDVQEDMVTLQLPVDELLVISNALNEVCHGIDVPDFQTRMGASLEDIRLLLSIISDCIDKAGM